MRIPGVEKPLKVLLDTGARRTIFCMTKTGLDKVRRGTNRWTRPPGRVRLQFDGTTDTLQEMTIEKVSASFDFAVGLPLLFQLQAVIDYVNWSITFKLNRKQFRVNLFPW